MNRAESPALRGTWLGRLLSFWNPVMRRLLVSPLHFLVSRWFVLIAYTGRKTGRLHQVPVSYVRDRGRLQVTTGDRWWHNLDANDAIALNYAGRWRSARATPVLDHDQSRSQHVRLFRDHPWFRFLAGIPATKGNRPDVKALDRSIDAGRALIGIDLLG